MVAGLPSSSASLPARARRTLTPDVFCLPAFAGEAALAIARSRATPTCFAGGERLSNSYVLFYGLSARPPAPAWRLQSPLTGASRRHTDAAFIAQRGTCSSRPLPVGFSSSGSAQVCM